MAMTITSFFYFVFLLVGGIIYYLVPGKVQWIILLGMSLLFYHYAAADYTIVFLILSTLIAYIASNLMRQKKIRDMKKANTWIAVITIGAVFFNALAWFSLKGSSFWITGSRIVNRFIPSFPTLSALPLIGALGMGYYTAQIIGYIIDCYWGDIEPQKNPFKLFLFTAFFPQLTVGPISRYSDLESLYVKHTFSYRNLCFGCQRILWGLFKKIVVADRINLITRAIWADSTYWVGFWPWIALLLYPLQMYADFSGCMDIVLGAAELFDIHLAENFNNPFFSRNIQEFWQRWHMTLGEWARTYVYYPILKSRLIQFISKWARKQFKSRIAKLIPWVVGMGILWLVMGFWHGAVQYIVGVSAWFWLVLVIGELFVPVSKKLIEFLNINTDSFSWHLLQSIRTYILVAFGLLFFISNGVGDAVGRCIVLYRGLHNLNPWIFFDGSITGLGVTYRDINIIIVGTFLFAVVAILRERYGYARNWMQKQILPFRWLAWMVLFIIVAVYGLYGPGYDATAFIYEGF